MLADCVTRLMLRLDELRLRLDRGLSMSSDAGNLGSAFCKLHHFGADLPQPGGGGRCARAWACWADKSGVLTVIGDHFRGIDASDDQADMRFGMHAHVRLHRSLKLLPIHLSWGLVGLFTLQLL